MQWKIYADESLYLHILYNTIGILLDSFINITLINKVLSDALSKALI